MLDNFCIDLIILILVTYLYYDIYSYKHWNNVAIPYNITLFYMKRYPQKPEIIFQMDLKKPEKTWNLGKELLLATLS